VLGPGSVKIPTCQKSDSDGQNLDALGKLALVKRLKLAEETIQGLLDAVRSVARLAQGPIAHSCLVEVELYEEDLPDVTAFDPPPITESI